MSLRRGLSGQWVHVLFEEYMSGILAFVEEIRKDGTLPPCGVCVLGLYTPGQEEDQSNHYP